MNNARILNTLLVILLTSMHYMLEAQRLEEWNTEPLRPYDIAVLDNGQVWLNHRADSGEDRPGTVFTVDPGTGTVSEYASEYNATFYTVDAGEGNLLWIGDSEHGLIRFDPLTGHFTPHALPEDLFTNSDEPLGFIGVRSGPEGRVWFTNQTDTCIGFYNPMEDSWGRYDLNRDGSELRGLPVELDIDRSGNIWFTIKKVTGFHRGESVTAKGGLGLLRPLTGEMQFWTGGEMFPDDCFAFLDEPTSPHGIVIADDMVWFLDHHCTTLISFDPASPDDGFECFQLLDGGGHNDPHYLVHDTYGTLWITAFGKEQLIAFDTETKATKIVGLANHSQPMGIAFYQSDRMLARSFYIWIAESSMTGEAGVARYYQFPRYRASRPEWWPEGALRRLNLVDCTTCPECFDRPCDPRQNPQMAKFAIWDIKNDILKSFSMTKLELRPEEDGPLSAAAPTIDSKGRIQFVAAAPNANDGAGSVIFFNSNEEVIDRISGTKYGRHLGRSMDVRGPRVVVASNTHIVLLEDSKAVKAIALSPEMNGHRGVYVAFTDDMDGDRKAEILVGLPYSSNGAIKEAGQIMLIGSRNFTPIPVAVGRKAKEHVGMHLYPLDMSFTPSKTQQRDSMAQKNKR